MSEGGRPGKSGHGTDAPNLPYSGAEPERWVAHPWASRGIRFGAFFAPIVISVLITKELSHRIDRPDSLVAHLGWWIVLSTYATCVVVLFERVTRRLLPLSTLLGFSLVFPDRAPSRFGTALRSGTVTKLQHQIERARTEGLGDDLGEAARRLVELAGALSMHDRLTRGHSERVRAYTKLIAEELRLPEAEVDRLQWAGLAHDVGKLFIPVEILNKPGSLTDAEYEMIKTHATLGAELTEPLRGWLGDALDGVGQHHERWDGKGYPNGLAGHQISRAGRIIAVADVFDVITSVRSYKKASAVSHARQELIRCSGTQFDPRMVRAFLNVGLGRLRLLVGPLSWLAQLPVAATIPVGGAVAPATASFGAAAALTVGGFLGPTPDPRVDRDQLATSDVADAPPETVPEPISISEPKSATTTSTTTGPTADAEPQAASPSPPTTASPTSTTLVASSPTSKPAPPPPFVPPPFIPPSSAPPSPTTTGPPTTTAPSTTTTAPPATTTTTTPPTTTTTTTTTRPAASGEYHLGASGSDPLPLSSTPPSGGGAEPDHDGDGNPGITVEHGNQQLTETDPDKFQLWSLPVSSPLVLDGPVVVDLWSTVEDFEDDEDIDYSFWLMDCAADGTDCRVLTSTVDVHVDEWNRDTETWVRRTITIGSVDTTIAARRELVLRAMFGHHDVWIATSGARPSKLILPIAP